MIPFLEVIGKAILFLSTIIVARSTTTVGFGLFNYIVSITLVIGSLMDAGLSNYSFTLGQQGHTKKLAQQKKMRIITSVIVLIFFNIFILMLHRDIFWYVLLYSIFTCFNGLISQYKMSFRSVNENKCDAFSILSGPAIRVFLLSLGLVMYRELRLEYILGIFVFAEISAYLIANHFFKLRFGRVVVNDIASEFRSVFFNMKNTAPFILYGVFAALLYRYDVFFIEKHLGLSDTASYSVAFGLTQLGILFMGSFVSSKFRHIDLYRRNYLAGSVLLILLIGFIGLFCSKYLELLICAIYGDAYSNVAPLLLMMLLSIPACSMNYFFMIKHNAKGFTFRLVWIYILLIISKALILEFIISQTLTSVSITYALIEYLQSILLFVSYLMMTADNVKKGKLKEVL